MAEYIDREAVRIALCGESAITMKGVKILNQFPAADVAEVVRCRLCKNSAYHSAKKCWCREYQKFVPLVGFCSYGKKMDEKGER